MKKGFKIRDNVYVVFESGGGAPEGTIGFSIIDSYEYKVIEKSIWEGIPETDGEFLDAVAYIAEMYGIEADNSNGIEEVGYEELEEILV